MNFKEYVIATWTLFVPITIATIGLGIWTFNDKSNIIVAQFFGCGLGIVIGVWPMCFGFNKWQDRRHRKWN